MKLNSPVQVRKLIEQLEMSPSKTLGQNFLIDGNIRELIVRAAQLTEDDVVLEIGPGLGAMTELIVPSVKKLIAVEKDRILCRHLEREFPEAMETGRFELIEGDALKVDMQPLFGEGITRVLSNLPYKIGNRILLQLILSGHIPELFAVMVQKDVALRMVAVPGTREYGVLSILLQLFYEVEIVKHVSPTCFVPVPRVWSSVVRMVRRPDYAQFEQDLALLPRVVKQCFSQRRKQMQRILRKWAGPEVLDGQAVQRVLDAVGLDGAERPENLSVAEWVQFSRCLAEQRIL